VSRKHLCLWQYALVPARPSLVRHPRACGVCVFV
jgi:hypothetical protein